MTNAQAELPHILLKPQPIGLHELSTKWLKEWALGYLAGGSQRVRMIWEGSDKVSWSIETRTRAGTLIDLRQYRTADRALRYAGKLLRVKFEMEAAQ